MRLRGIFAASLAALIGSACTLTDDDFEPTLVESMSAGDGVEGEAPRLLETPPESGRRESTAPCGGASELAGCVTAIAPPVNDCVGAGCDLAVPSCSDGTRSPGEGGVDCGGSCTARCATGSSCSEDRDCVSRWCHGERCREPSCDDGIRGPGESDIDCGGACPARCATGRACASSDDCRAELYCSEQTERCEGPTCQDGVPNGTETDADCGGDECPGCPDGSPCVRGSDCLSAVCGTDQRCTAASCDDEVRNQDETAADCGGSCNDKCDSGQGCESGDDCASGVCGSAGCAPGTARCCLAPTCEDGVRNGTETVVDCGDAACGLCPLERPCIESAQCGSGFCAAGLCRMHPCEDRTLNGTESDVDCGGSDPRCARCSVGGTCNGDGDCNGAPCLNGVCFGCANGLLDANESDIDCGGACGPCAAGQSCQADADCERGACQDGRCCGGVGVDCTRCARRLAQATLACEFSRDPVAVDNCNRFLDCLAQHPAQCPVRHAQSCSIDPGGVCNHTAYGGNNNPGVNLADAIIGTAACNF